MALTKCKDCKEEISKKAKSCPKCGAPVKKGTSLFTWLIAIFILFAVISLLASKQNVAIQPTAQVQQQTVKKDSNKMNSLEKQVKKIFQGTKEPTAKDAVWTAHGIFKVGVIDDGTLRNGYADYVCQVLYDNGFKGQKVWVQIIDIAKLTRSEKWVKLGEAHCQ